MSDLSVFGLYSYLSRCFILLPILSSAIKSQAIPRLYRASRVTFTDVWFGYVIRTQAVLFIGGLCTVFLTYTLFKVLPKQEMYHEITSGLLAFIWIFVFDRNVGNLQFFGPERDGYQHYQAFTRFLF